MTDEVLHFTERVKAHRVRFEQEALLLARTAPRRGLGRRLVFLHGRFISRLVRDMARAAISAQEDLSLQKRLMGEVAVALTGGSGRADAGPFGDVDIAIIPKADSDWLSGFLATFSHLLREVGDKAQVKFSCLYRPVSEFKQLDHDSQTSLLDARLVLGSAATFRAMCRAVRRDLEVLDFVDSRYRQYRHLHRKWNETVFNLEPDVKESPGCLRDFQYTLWMTQATYAVGREEALRTLLTQELVRPQYLRAARRARDFLLAVRVLLHLRGQGENNLLTRPAQQAIAGHLGYEDKPELSAQEQFMDEFFRHIDVLYRTCRHILDRLKDQPKRLERGVDVVSGRLHLKSEIRLENDPPLIMRLFGYVATYGLRMTGATYSALENATAIIDDDFRSDAAVGRQFLEIFRKPHTVNAIRRMLISGVLEAYMPELKGVQFRIPREGAHVLTVGEHSLRTLMLIKRIRNGEDLEAIGYPAGDDGVTFPAHVMEKVDGKGYLAMATWLHDIGKLHDPAEHCASGAALVRRIMRRMGFRKDRVEDVVFLVEKHLLMPSTSRKYQLDEKTVQRMVTACQDPNPGYAINRLHMLYLLSLADSIATNPPNWDGVNRVRLDELYQATLRFLEKGEHDLDEAGRRAEIIESVKRAYRLATQEPVAEEDIHQHCENMPPSYLNLPREAIVRHLQMVRALQTGEQPVALSFNRYKDVNFSELTICMADPGPGLLARISGALYAAGVDIHDADIYTRHGQPKVAVDILKITYCDGPVMYDSDEERISAMLMEVLTGQSSVEDLLARKRKSTPTTALHNVVVRNDLSDSATVVEISTSDDNGVLYLLSSFFQRFGYDIHYASAAPWTHGACDVFYITQNGEKLSDERNLRHQLLSWIMANESVMV